MKRAIVFPGQGSQVVGMGRGFAEALPACRDVFGQANDVLGYDLAQVCFAGPQDELNKSHHAQLGIFVASVAAFRAWQARGPQPEYDVLAGHSLGEWTALHLAGVSGFEQTLKILQVRGEAMQAACEQNPGAMLAVMNLEAEKLVGIADEAGCHVANFNSLVQTVLSGTAESIGRAEALCREAGAKRTVRLPVAGAFHSPLMQPAADRVEAYLSGVELAEPQVPVLSNVTADVHEPGAVRGNMVKQIVSPVRWVASVQKMVADGVGEMVECGPGKVLAGLVKRIDKTVPVRNIGQLSDLEKE